MKARHDPPTEAELTDAELADLVVQAGALTREQVVVMYSGHDGRSEVSHAAMRELHSLRMAGRLTLCTRPLDVHCPAHGVR